MITYRLSGRQAKELLGRGQVLRVAVPWPPGSEAAPLEIARTALPDVAAYVVAADECELCVTPPGGPGLTGYLGRIQDQPYGLCWLLPAVVATLRTPSARGKPGPIQWAGTAYCSDKRWPPREEGEGDAET